MADFTSASPAKIQLSVASFLRQFGDGGVNPGAVFVSDSGNAKYSFTTGFPGSLVAQGQGLLESITADIGADTGVPKANWANYSPIAKGVIVAIYGPGSFVTDHVSTLADFISAPAATPLTSASFSSTAPLPILLSPLVGTEGFYGVAAGTILDSAGVTANLAITTTPTIPGTYAIPAGGYKYLALPAAMPALAEFKDNATGLSIPLAGSGEGYNQIANTLRFALVTIGGASYRLYRSQNVLGGAVVLAIA